MSTRQRINELRNIEKDRSNNPVDLSIIIVSFNTKDLLDRCLSSIYLSKPKISFEIFVVDNVSSDGSSELVKEKYPDVKLIQNSENVGFAKANNQALRICSGRYALLLNSDTEIIGNALDVMVEFMDNHKEAGMINPKLVYSNMELQPSPSKLPSFWKGVVWERIFWCTHLHRLFRKQYKYKAIEKGRDYDKVTEIEWARGACLMIRREVIEEVGLLDETFFFGYEEADYNIRVSKEGWRRYYVPHAVVIHHGSLSHVKYGRGLRARIDEGMFYYCEKHFGFISALIARVVVIGIALIYVGLRPIKVFLSKDKVVEATKFKYDWETIKTAAQIVRPFFLLSSHEYIMNSVDCTSWVLDVGCDRGQLARALIEQKDCKVVGIEKECEKINGWQNALEHFEVIVGDIENPGTLKRISKIIDEKGRKFDVIILGDVLEHLVNPHKVLMSLRRYLAPWGKLLVSLPNVAYWRVRMDLLLGKFVYSEYGILDRTHLRFFTRATASTMFRDCGYKVNSIRYTSGNFSKKGMRKAISSLMVRLCPTLFAFQFVFEIVDKGKRLLVTKKDNVSIY